MKRLALSCATIALLAVRAPCADLSLGIDGGYFDMTNARQSAKAVFGDIPGGYILGASIRWQAGDAFFVGIGGRFFQREGQRAFVADKNSPPFRLGHPLTLRIIPVHAFVGYRFSPLGRLVPYVGLGPGLATYRETSVVGELEVEPVSETKFSGQLLAGFESGRGRLRFGVEAAYSIVPNSAGVAGVSKVYGESDIGGVTIVGRLVLTRE